MAKVRSSLIVGEAGIGKSRLVQRFREQIAGTPTPGSKRGGRAFFQNTPFYPVAEMLQQSSSARQPVREPARSNSSRTLAAAGLEPAEAVPLIAPLLNLPPSREVSAVVAVARPTARALAGDAGRVDARFGQNATAGDCDRGFALGRSFDAGADPTAGRAGGDRAAAAPVHGATRVPSALADARASHADHAQPAERARHAHDGGAGGGAKALSDETVATVVERTGGVPLFVEELTRAVLESGDAKLTGREIPATLHDSLMARLDRLGAGQGGHPDRRGNRQ